jgi:hypothetical protein
MPITQDRIHALVCAAESAVARHNALVAALRRLTNDPESDIATELPSLLLNTENMLDPQAVARIAAERTHYNLTHKRNTRAAGKRRLDRGQDFYEPRLTHTPYEGPELSSYTAPPSPVTPCKARAARAPSSDEIWHTDDSQGECIGDIGEIYVEPSMDIINRAIAQADAPPPPDLSQPVIALPDDHGDDSANGPNSA